MTVICKHWENHTRKINVFHLHFHSPHATITHRVNDKSHTKGCTTTVDNTELRKVHIY